MKANLPKPGRYVVAVSGGIDSVCLLDMMAKSKEYDLIVAHYDHGIRLNSQADMVFVSQLAKGKKLKFVSVNGKLGQYANEDRARRARYEFLFQVKQEVEAQAIITGHHLDDRLETLVINLIRGTGRLGVGSINETETIKRPLLKLNRVELISYAHQHNLSWREDSTNQDNYYLRNYIRLKVIPRLSEQDKQSFVKLMDQQTDINHEIDQLIGLWLKAQYPEKLNKALINRLSYNESKELIASWLRYNNLVNFDRKTIERLTLGAKTKPSGTKLDVYNFYQVTINKEYLALNTIER